MGRGFARGSTHVAAPLHQNNAKWTTTCVAYNGANRDKLMSSLLTLPFTHPLAGGLHKCCRSRLSAYDRDSLATSEFATAPAQRFVKIDAPDTRTKNTGSRAAKTTTLAISYDVRSCVGDTGLEPVTSTMST